MHGKEWQAPDYLTLQLKQGGTAVTSKLELLQTAEQLLPKESLSMLSQGVLTHLLADTISSATALAGGR